MTLFRVLSEEESRKVTRWKAPELGTGATVVANTRQEAKPQQQKSDASVKALLGSLDLKAGQRHSPASAPQLQTISPIDVFAHSAIARANGAEGGAMQVSAELLQTSYDEGYSRGFAEGNVALHEHAIKELRTVIAALSAASTRPEDSALEHELVALAMEIARVVIRREVSLAPDIMHEIVTAGLEQLESHSSSQRVYLHPLDARIVGEQVSEDSTITVLDDPALERGACRIESGSSVVNAGIEDWLNNVSVQLGLSSEVDVQDSFDPTSATLAEDDDSPASEL